MSMVKNEDFKIVKGEDKLKLYQFHTKVAKHYFCSNCGIYTHHNPRSNPAMTGFNLGCIDEINTFDLKDIALMMVKIILWIKKSNFLCKQVNICFDKVKKDCFKFIKSQETQKKNLETKKDD